MIADHSKQFPGAVLDPTPTGATYASATGDPFPNLGTFPVPFRTENMHPREIVFNNWKVSMPVVSLRLWAKQGHRSILDEDEGEFIHKETQEVDPYVAKHGVYFMKMRVDKRLLHDGCQAGFARPGKQ